MTVLNLQRWVHYQKKQAMLIGIIPGPKEAQGHINSFFKPIVDDLLYLHDGIKIRSVVMQEESFTSRAVLLCVLCDIPASRKVSQYLNFKASKLCDKCHMIAKREPGTAGACGRMCFLRERMPKRRNNQEVRAAMGQYKNAPSKHAVDVVAKVSGVKSNTVNFPTCHISTLLITSL